MAYIAYGASTQPVQISIAVTPDFLRALAFCGTPLAFMGALLWCRYALVVTVRRLAVQQRRSRPGWSVCPFQKAQPQQFFHVGAWFLLANALGNLLGLLCGTGISSAALALGGFGGAFGAGMLAGLQWLIHAHPEYFSGAGKA